MRKKTKELKYALAQQERAIRLILRAWDPLPGAPADEYDCIVQRLLSALHEGKRGPEFESVLIDEVEGHLGVKVSAGTGKLIGKRIEDSWQQQEGQRRQLHQES